MPIETKAFKCAFGCKRNVLVSKSRMIKHEEKCTRNPDVKACITCEHDSFEEGDSETGYGGGQFCEIDKKPKGAHFAGIIGCEFWKSKTG